MLVKNVKFKNDKVEIILEECSVFISKENYIENPITIASDLSEDKIAFLMEQEKIITVKSECVKKLNRKVLSEWEIEKYLKIKELNSKDVQSILKTLKNIGLVNDEYVAQLTVDSLLVKRKGKRFIVDNLKEKKININIIDKVIKEIEEEVYLDNFDKVFSKYFKMYSSKSGKIKETMIKKKLKEYGYEEELISSISLAFDKEEEIKLAKKYCDKIIKNNKKVLDSYQLNNKIRTKLAMKGFNYDIINIVLGEVNDDETY